MIISIAVNIVYYCGKAVGNILNTASKHDESLSFFVHWHLGYKPEPPLKIRRYILISAYGIRIESCELIGKPNFKPIRAAAHFTIASMELTIGITPTWVIGQAK